MFAAMLVVMPGCDEDRPTVVAAKAPTTESNPNQVAPTGKNPISGNRKSTLGKAYDVAEDLVDNKIPDYQKRIEEEQKKAP